jgi:hypothetical protein
LSLANSIGLRGYSGMYEAKQDFDEMKL